MNGNKNSELNQNPKPASRPAHSALMPARPLLSGRARASTACAGTPSIRRGQPGSGPSPKSSSGSDSTPDPPPDPGENGAAPGAFDGQTGSIESGTVIPKM